MVEIIRIRISDFGFGSSFGLRHSGFLSLNLNLNLFLVHRRVSLFSFLNSLFLVEFLAGRVRPKTWRLSPVDFHNLLLCPRNYIIFYYVPGINVPGIIIKFANRRDSIGPIGYDQNAVAESAEEPVEGRR